MQSITIKNLYQQGIFDGVSVLRQNVSGYPYITLLKDGDKTKSTNLYFSRKSSALVMDNFEVGSPVSKILGQASVVLTENENKEKRFKISLSEQGTDYESAASLEDVFGIREKNINFDIELFKKEFTSIEPVTVPQEEVV